jgi:hypothetical protein
MKTQRWEDRCEKNIGVYRFHILFLEKLKNASSIAVDFGGGSFKLSRTPLEGGRSMIPAAIAAVLRGVNPYQSTDAGRH